jgi:hypothetical protein
MYYPKKRLKELQEDLNIIQEGGRRRRQPPIFFSSRASRSYHGHGNGVKYKILEETQDGDFLFFVGVPENFSEKRDHVGGIVLEEKFEHVVGPFGLLGSKDLEVREEERGEEEEEEGGRRRKEGGGRREERGGRREEEEGGEGRSLRSRPWKRFLEDGQRGPRIRRGGRDFLLDVFGGRGRRGKARRHTCSMRCVMRVVRLVLRVLAALRWSLTEDMAWYNAAEEG